jgi:multicomponent Na+:H+ antiporter subunit B
VIITLIDIILLGFLAATALAIVWLRSLFAAAMLSGIYSLLMAGLFVTLDAVDVAFTEAAVGAGISTVLMLGTLYLTKHREKIPPHTPFLPLIVVLLTGAALVYATLGMPKYGDPTAPVQQHVGADYIERTPREIGVPNIVTGVLASYRGFDTLGEVTVIFTAGIGVMVILGGRRRKVQPGRNEGDS